MNGTYDRDNAAICHGDARDDADENCRDPDCANGLPILVAGSDGYGIQRLRDNGTMDCDYAGDRSHHGGDDMYAYGSGSTRAFSGVFL